MGRMNVADLSEARDLWLACARRGDFEAAWAISDRILAEHVAKPDTSRPRHLQSVWNGRPLHGNRVLIRCYQGLGDTIQFIRYASMVRAIARQVIVWAPAELLPVIRSVDGIDEVLPLHDGDPGAAYDVDVEVMELPYVFRSTLHTLPQRIPYLSAERAVLPGAPPHIGLFWRGGGWEPRRWMRFDDAIRLLDIAGATWCSLQHNHRPDESDPRLIPIGHGSVADLASRVAQLDLLITIDSMPAHLAGALGVPVWTLLRKDADWRWLQDRHDTPWYPTMRLFRQQVEGDWAGVVERVADALIDARCLHQLDRSVAF